jgi:signal transduction histidine kinase
MPFATNDILRAMHSIFIELSKTSSVDELAKEVVARGRSFLELDRIAFYSLDQESHKARLVVTTGADGRPVAGADGPDLIEGMDDLLVDSLLGHESLVLREGLELRGAGKAASKGWLALVPLHDGIAPRGWIAADNQLKGLPLEPATRELLCLYGRMIGAIAAHLQREEELARRVDEKTQALSASEAHYKALSEELKRQNDAKEKLFAILAHDLRGPIGNLKALVAMACDEGAFGDAELRAMMPSFRASLEASYDLLDNLLGWVRSQMEEIVALLDTVDLAATVERVRSWLDEPAARKGVRIEARVEGHASARTDERMVEAILRNLVSNAVKFSPKGSAVRIEARGGDSAVGIVVIDEGPGIATEKLAGLFELAKREIGVGTAGEKGSGLGLAFSKELADKLGARIEVESEPGKGSRFTLILPARVEGELPIA